MTDIPIDDDILIDDVYLEFIPKSTQHGYFIEKDKFDRMQARLAELESALVIAEADIDALKSIIRNLAESYPVHQGPTMRWECEVCGGRSQYYQTAEDVVHNDDCAWVAARKFEDAD